MNKPLSTFATVPNEELSWMLSVHERFNFAIGVATEEASRMKAEWFFGERRFARRFDRVFGRMMLDLSMSGDELGFSARHQALSEARRHELAEDHELVTALAQQVLADTMLNEHARYYEFSGDIM